jgi:hypothetical protein
MGLSSIDNLEHSSDFSRDRTRKNAAGGIVQTN